ncbi:serine hydrolase domain-containing protein [Gudongella sp. DL1XJH-153]|uniref:serine hydrolase domain-containing protein n=1 Tax=Gudongella sp. DL1XJH-153 TaxID=3409804 RepID=UPI003BB5095E
MDEKKPVSNGLTNRMLTGILMTVFIFVTILIGSHLVAPAMDVQKDAPSYEFINYLERRIDSLMGKYKIPGVSISLVKEGRIIWSGAYGYSDIEDNSKIDIDTYFRVESISKSVTAWGVMKLVEDGEIDLDKPITRYISNWKIPQSRFSYDNITVRQLLTHTSGMPLGDFLDRYPPEEEMPSLEESLSQKAIPIQMAGKEFFYSNIGYNLLELLVEEVTGEDFASYMKNMIMIPIGMKQSTFNFGDIAGESVPTGYDIKGEPVQPYVYPEKASGGLISTVEDVALFMMAGMDDEYRLNHDVLENKSVDELYSKRIEEIGVYGLVFDGYGMGYYLEDLSNGIQSIANGGQGGGVMTYFHSIPETGDGIVILTNSQRSWPFFGHVVNVWGMWNGHGEVGFGKIIIAQNILWAAVLLLFIIFLVQLHKVLLNLINGRSRFSCSSLLNSPKNLLRMVVSLSALMGLLWSINQDYLFLTSIFPIVSSWIGAVILLLALEQALMGFLIDF